MLDTLRQDLAYAFRQLKLAPSFTTVAVLSLALGIGANTAIFQLIDAVRLRTLPVEDPSRLAVIDYPPKSSRSGNWSTRSARFTSAQVDYLTQHQQTFDSVMSWSATRFNLADGGEPRYAEGVFVSGNFFDVLGVRPQLGRFLTPEDDVRACPNPGAVISHPFWQRQFGGERSIVGKNVHVNGQTFPIIGVSAPSFFGVEVGRSYDVMLPLCADRLLTRAGDDTRADRKDAWWLSLMGRLKPNLTIQQATAQLEALAPGLMQATVPPSYKKDLVERFLRNKLRAEDGSAGVSGLRRQYETSLIVLMSTTGLVLLIACANLANLLLARASVRERELAVRLAIGASRARLIRQLLAESFLLAAAGAVGGILLAQFLSHSLIGFITTRQDPLYVDMTLDWRLIGFTAALALITCLLFGLLPAWRSTQMAPASAIRSGGRSVTAGRERFSLRRGLVVTQVALSLVLLVGALLFVRSLTNLLSTEAGFQAEGVMHVDLNYEKANIPAERRLVTNRELQDKVAGLPGIIGVAQVMMTPVSGSGWDQDIGPDRQPAAGSGLNSLFNRVSPGYFQTMGTKLLAGREFDDRDNASAPPVAIVNDTFARRFFKGQVDIVGRTFHREAAAGKPETLYQIVGVVKSAKYYELREDFRPVAFFPMAQDDRPAPGTNLVLRVAGSPSAAINAVRQTLLAVNPTMALEFRSFSSQIQDSLLREQLMAMLSGAFAVLAVLLAALGLYGVIAYMVARRQSEIGVRMALGADRGSVIALVLRETGLLMVVGLIIGTALALWAGKGAASMLYGLKPYDLATMAGAVALLALAGLLASYAPARRAASLDPMTALRNE